MADLGKFNVNIDISLVSTEIDCYFFPIGCLSIQTVAICEYLESFSALFFLSVLLGENQKIVQIDEAVLILGDTTPLVFK